MPAHRTLGHAGGKRTSSQTLFLPPMQRQSLRSINYRSEFLLPKPSVSPSDKQAWWRDVDYYSFWKVRLSFIEVAHWPCRFIFIALRLIFSSSVIQTKNLGGSWCAGALCVAGRVDEGDSRVFRGLKLCMRMLNSGCKVLVGVLLTTSREHCGSFTNPAAHISVASQLDFCLLEMHLFFVCLRLKSDC